MTGAASVECSCAHRLAVASRGRKLSALVDPHSQRFALADVQFGSNCLARSGMMRQEYVSAFCLVSELETKSTPGERCNWLDNDAFGQSR